MRRDDLASFDSQMASLCRLPHGSVRLCREIQVDIVCVDRMYTPCSAAAIDLVLASTHIPAPDLGPYLSPQR